MSLVPVRVALSGSGFKFPAHVGAISAIEKTGHEIVELAGTSGGSIVAALFACGMPADEMRDLTMQRDWSDMLSWSPLSLMTKMGYCSGKKLMDFLTERTEGRTFADLSIDLTIVASDVSGCRPFVFSRDQTPDAPVALAVRASAAIPFVYTPIQYRGAWLMDGGMVNNIPVDRLKHDETKRLGVQLVTRKKPLSDGLHTVFDIAPRLVELMLDANENTHLDLGERLGARIAFVETGYASGLDRNMPGDVRQRLMDDGYRGALGAL